MSRHADRSRCALTRGMAVWGESVMRAAGSLRIILNIKLFDGMAVEHPSQRSLRVTAIEQNDHPSVYLIFVRAALRMPLWERRAAVAFAELPKSSPMRHRLVHQSDVIDCNNLYTEISRLCRLKAIDAAASQKLDLKAVEAMRQTSVPITVAPANPSDSNHKQVYNDRSDDQLEPPDTSSDGAYR